MDEFLPSEPSSSCDNNVAMITITKTLQSIVVALLPRYARVILILAYPRPTTGRRQTHDRAADRWEGLHGVGDLARAEAKCYNYAREI